MIKISISPGNRKLGAIPSVSLPACVTCNPVALDGETVKINAPIVSSQEKLIGYTIRSTSSEGEYYLINGWYKYFGFWLRCKDISADYRNAKKITFKTIGSAKASLSKLLKIMPDYKTDAFKLCAIYARGETIVIHEH